MAKKAMKLIDPNIIDPNIIDPNIIDPNIIDPNIIDPNIIDPNTALWNLRSQLCAPEFTRKTIIFIK